VTEYAPLFARLPKAVRDEQPRTMEKYDQGHGCILYRTKIPAGPVATLEAASVHDFGFVFLNGERVGVMDRRNGNFNVRLPERKKSATLDILVEAMGRVNFGQEVHDRKGIHAPVKLEGKDLTGWQIFNLPLDEPMLARLKFQSRAGVSPARVGEADASLPRLKTGSLGRRDACPTFWRATVNIAKPGDTFLDLRSWGKGVVWVNGHCLGRFWNIGPTQTAYVPGCWLRTGKNEIVIFDLIGPEKPVIAGLEKPVLNELHPEKDFARAHRPKVTLQLDSVKPVLAASFAPGSQIQEIKFEAPVKGRFFCLESLSAFDGKPFAAVAELDLLDASGRPLSHEGWTIACVDSEERGQEDGTAENAIDGQTANYWHTEWSAAQPNHTHQLVLDLGKSQTISGFRYVPRQGAGTGRIKDYRIYVGDNLIRK
jgi:beta-galactosidase